MNTTVTAVDMLGCFMISAPYVPATATIGITPFRKFVLHLGCLEKYPVVNKIIPTLASSPGMMVIGPTAIHLVEPLASAPSGVRTSTSRARHITGTITQSLAQK